MGRHFNVIPAAEMLKPTDIHPSLAGWQFGDVGPLLLLLLQDKPFIIRIVCLSRAAHPPPAKFRL